VAHQLQENAPVPQVWLSVTNNLLRQGGRPDCRERVSPPHQESCSSDKRSHSCKVKRHSDRRISSPHVKHSATLPPGS
jgi:hypothetical protein